MIPKMQAMDTANTRAEFELRFHHLKEMIESGRMRGPQNLGESLSQLRHLPNGRLDFLSVDEIARVQANTMYHFSSRSFTPNGFE